MTAGSEVAKDRVNGGFVVDGDRSGFQVLDEFPDPHDLTGCPELLLERIERVDGGLGTVGAVEVPGEEAGEVLDCSEDFVTANFGDVSLGDSLGICGDGGDRVRIMGYRRHGDVVDTAHRTQFCLYTDFDSSALQISRTSRRDKAQIMSHRRVVD